MVVVVVGGGGGGRGHWDEGGGEEVMAHVSESTAVERSEGMQVGGFLRW